MAEPEIVFAMPDNILSSGSFSGIDIHHAGSNYSIRNQENQPFWPIFTYLIKFRLNRNARDCNHDAG
jgi:hypothetical protein